MSAHHANSFLENGLGWHDAGFHELLRVQKNPGIIKSAAANADACATGFFEHHFRGLWRSDITVANDRNSFHGFDHRANSGKIHSAAKALLAGPTMNKK